jgi:RNA polymerase sigma-70 factor, ECF subfamily
VNAHHRPSCPDAEAAWRDLRGPLLSFIGRRVSDRDSAEDILQEVMLRIHRHAGELSDVSAVGGWIHEIARNAIIDHYRRAVVRRERPVGSEAELDRPTPAMPEPGPAELRTELAACLEPLLAQLPPIYRDALRLTDLAGLTRADAAARIGLSTSGMKTRVPLRPRQTPRPSTHPQPRSTGRGLAQGNSSADRVNGSRRGWSSPGSAGRTRSRTARRMAGERRYQSARAGVASAVASSGPVMSTAFCSSLAWWSCHVIWPRWSPPGRGIPDIRV